MTTVLIIKPRHVNVVVSTVSTGFLFYWHPTRNIFVVRQRAPTFSGSDNSSRWVVLSVVASSRFTTCLPAFRCNAAKGVRVLAWSL